MEKTITANGGIHFYFGQMLFSFFNDKSKDLFERVIFSIEGKREQLLERCSFGTDFIFTDVSRWVYLDSGSI